jgi:predicted membrane protein
MESTSQLVWAMVFGAIGLGFFVYGKKQKAVVPLLAGFALFIFPYFMPNVYMLVTVGAVLVALPYFVRM